MEINHNTSSEENFKAGAIKAAIDYLKVNGVLQEMLMDAFEEGFRSSGEGYNGEHGFNPKEVEALAIEYVKVTYETD